MLHLARLPGRISRTTSFLVKPKGFFISTFTPEATLITPEQTSRAYLIFLETAKAIVEKCISQDVIEQPDLFEGVTITLNRDSRIKSSVRIDEEVVIHEGAMLDHHTQIGKKSHIGPNAKILAGAILGQEVVVGEEAEVNYDLPIPDSTIIPAREIVTQAPSSFVTVNL